MHNGWEANWELWIDLGWANWERWIDLGWGECSGRSSVEDIRKGKGCKFSEVSQTHCRLANLSTKQAFSFVPGMLKVLSETKPGVLYNCCHKNWGSDFLL